MLDHLNIGLMCYLPLHNDFLTFKPNGSMVMIDLSWYGFKKQRLIV
jgi:hypothetical protein